MSTTSAPKELRPDAARQAPARPAPVASAGQPTAAARDASAAAGDAATARMLGAGQAPDESRWARFAHGVADGAQILAELVRLAIFNPFTGAAEGDLELGKALYYAQLVAPASALDAITLHAANRGSIPVHVKLNLYHSTFELRAPRVQIAGFHTATATGQACDLDGLVAVGNRTAVTVRFAGAHLREVTFRRGEQRLTAREVALTSVVASASGAETTNANLHFARARVLGLRYPNLAPIDLDLPGGTNLDAVWQHGPATTPAAPAHGPDGGAALPTPPDVLPPGASLAVELAGLQATGVVGGGAAAGGGGFARLRVALRKDGHDLAAVEITGFHAGATATAAGATIDRVELTGAPPMVEALLANPQVAAEPHVRSAMQLLRELRIRPSVNGTIAFAHLSLAHGPGLDRVAGDFSSTVALPGVGTLAMAMTGFLLGTDGGASGGFERFTATLTGEDRREVAHVELGGAAARNTDPTHRRGEVRRISARGNVAAVVAAGEALIHQLPLTVRSGFELIRALGITGDVEGSLAARSTGGKTEFTGDFTAHVAAGEVGTVLVTVREFHGDDTAARARFRRFEAKLTNPRGRVVASVAVEGGGGGAGEGGRAAVRAGAVDARGEGGGLAALIGALEQHASALPAPVRGTLAVVRPYFAAGSGHLALRGVDLADDGRGHQEVRLGDLAASFDLAGGDHAAISVSGLRGDRTAAQTTVRFARFEATLTSGGSRAAIVVEEGDGEVAAAPARGGAPDFRLHGHRARFEGEIGNIGKLLAGIRQRVGTLPAPIARAFEAVERYTAGHVQAAGATVALTATDTTVGAARGHQHGRGSLAATVAVPAGTAALALHDFAGEGRRFRFGRLELAVRDAAGAVAAAVEVGPTSVEESGAVTVGDVHASGDAARLRGVLDAQLGARVPPALARALEAVGASRFEAALASVTAAPTAGGGLVSDAAELRVTAAIAVTDAAGATYRSPDAALTLRGAHVVLGADRRPREISATSMEVRGAFSSAGGGQTLGGQATLHTGAARVTFAEGGAVRSVETSDVRLAGDGARTTAPAAAGPAPAAPTGAQRLAAHDRTAAQATTAAQMLRSADVHAHTPLQAGRYGSGLVHVEVPSGAVFHTSIQVRQYALTSGTRVVITPKLDAPLWMKVAGLELETAGTEGALKLGLDGFFDQDLTKYVVGRGTLSLDLAALVREIMGNLRGKLEAAAAGASAEARPARTPAPRRRDDDGLRRDHDRWAARAARHADPRDRARDAAEEPRSSDVGGLARALQLAQTTGDASLDLAAPGGEVGARLHGEVAGGGVVRLGASEARVQVGGHEVDAHGVDSGRAEVTTEGDTTRVRLAGLTIEHLRWLAP